MDDGRVQGVVALDLQSGKIEAITAGAVILCTGGCGRVFPFTTNAAIKTGDGMALAYRAGAPLKDMEFVQYHPTGLPFTGILITEAARAEGGYLINKDGYRYLQDYNLGTPQPQPVLRSMELGPRDRLSQAFMKEMEKGRTVETPYGHVVHLDLRHLGEKKIDAKIPFVRELCMKYQNLDPVKDLIPVRPVVHYMMGGVHTDINGATPLPGCTRRRDRMREHQRRQPARVELAARTAGVRRARRQSGGGVRLAGGLEINPASSRRRPMSTGGSSTTCSTSKGRERMADLRDAMQKAMERSAGIYRSGATLRRACDEIRQLQERSADIAIEDRSKTFNTERVAALELAFMLDVAEAIVNAAVRREESRGAHQRTDFPARDDVRFLAHSLVYREADGSARVDDLPVTITRWPPAERVYGEAGSAWRTNQATGRTISPGAGVRDYLRRVRGPVSERLGGPRRTESHQGPHRRHARRTGGRAGWASAAAAA